MKGEDTLSAILAALQHVDGYFVCEGPDGEEYIIAPKSFVDLNDTVSHSETQLRLEPVREAIDTPEGLAKINHDLALARDMTEAIAEDFDDLGIASEPEYSLSPESDGPAMPPPRRVRFEPIRGDLPPELQE